MKLVKISYEDLNSRQRENFNFHKIAAVLADYGFSSIRLNDDWQGADFIAQHIDGNTFVKVQLKSRCTIDKKYLGKGLFIAFPHNSSWFLYPHDELVSHLISSSNVANTESWITSGSYHFNSISQDLLEHLNQYVL